MWKLLLGLLLAAPAAPAAALELLLEDNKGESGTIGYVDIDRVFKDFSGTAGAREDFIAEIKKKEAALDNMKSGVFTLKAELAKLRQEREFALTLPSLMEAKASAEAVQQAAQAAVDAAKAAQTEAQAALQATPADPAAASGEAPPPLPAGLPGMPTLAAVNMPGVGAVPLTRFKFSVSTSVPEIDAAIAQKEAALKKGEDDLRSFQRLSEKELLEYETHKTEILLGRIYVALKELAVKEAVSVVIDKRNILFGQPAVDLTQKLLEKLEAPE
jgi:Skp family chaperone for outer membrane proteins